MPPQRYAHIGALKGLDAFRACLERLGLSIPCDEDLLSGAASPLAQPIEAGGLTIGNRWAIHPMEGWDGTTDGRPGEATFRRWKRFGASGAKLIWGGEAAAVSPDARANPNQLMATSRHEGDLTRLRETLVAEHTQRFGGDDGLVVGLQLTHSGRFARPNEKARPEPRILYRHPILDARLGLGSDYPLITDAEVRAIVEAFAAAARTAGRAGFQFVDVKHCHGYLGHEFLSAHTREGPYGGSFENRTRFLREVVQAIRAEVPGLAIGVRVSVFDSVPYRPDPKSSRPGRPGPGVPEDLKGLLPYRWGFGVDTEDPTQPDLTEAFQFLELLRSRARRLSSPENPPRRTLESVGEEPLVLHAGQEDPVAGNRGRGGTAR